MIGSSCYLDDIVQLRHSGSISNFNAGILNVVVNCEYVTVFSEESCLISIGHNIDNW